MIDHSGVSVSDVARGETFYHAALAPLGYTLLMDGEQYAGFGVAPKPHFGIGQGKPNVPPIYVAFRGESRALVDAFYRPAMASRGSDNGAPGPRPHYHSHCYGALVLDPDGHNIEAVCDTAE